MQKEDRNAENWYYDACTLDRSKSSYGEMFNKNPIKAYFSHLTLGEAFGNCYLKGEEQLEAFVNLIKNLKPYIKIVENDGCNNVLDRTLEEFPRLSITDAIHVATAIKNQCVVLKTIDKDLYDLDRNKLNKLGREFSLPHFSINKPK